MPPEDDIETELSIGARNPFVYAEHKLKETIKWHQMSTEDKHKKIKDAFEVDTYEEIFDPIHESNLFVGDMRPCNPISDPQWAPIGLNYTIGTRAYNDPVQGDLPDCYLIAALSSLAFLNMIPAKLTLPAPEPPNTFSFTFYNPPATAPVKDDVPVKITYNLPLEKPNGIYHYSRSFTAGEIWIAMYEKAYARWINRRAGTDSDTPDYKIICQGDPMFALMNLTGWKFSATSRFSTLGLSETQIYDKINAVCRTSGIYRTTTKPMVAYTYDPRIEPQPITYTDATIVGNHAYSVLGVHTIGSEKYIVMRNPWGQKDPNSTGLPSGALASGPWYQNANLADPNDACFALKASVFKVYFKGFGWIYP